MARHGSMLPDVLWETFGSETARNEGSEPRAYLGVYDPTVSYSEGVCVGVETGGPEPDCGVGVWAAARPVPAYTDVEGNTDQRLFEPCADSVRADVEGRAPIWTNLTGRALDLQGDIDPNGDAVLSVSGAVAPGSTFVNTATGDVSKVDGTGAWSALGGGAGGDGAFSTLKVGTDFRVGFDANGDPVTSDGNPQVGLIVWSQNSGHGVLTVDAEPTDPPGDGSTDNAGFFGGAGLNKGDRPTIATQVGAVSVADFNALRLALVRFGLVIDGDGD